MPCAAESTQGRRSMWSRSRSWRSRTTAQVASASSWPTSMARWRRCGRQPGSASPGAVPLRRSPVARDRDRRLAARRLLDAARDGARTDAREHRRGRGRRAAPAPPHGWACRAGSGRRCARPCRLRGGRGGGQCRVRAGVVAAGRCDLGRRARAGVSHLGAWRRRRCPGGRAGSPHMGGRGSAGHPAARARGGHGRARRSGGAGGADATTRCALHRLPGPVVGGSPPRAARSRHGRPRRVLDHGLEHGAERWAVRARLDHRQPARDAALHRRLGAHIAGARARRPRSAPGRRRSRQARCPSAHWRTSRRRCAGWPRLLRADCRRAAYSGR